MDLLGAAKQSAKAVDNGMSPAIRHSKRPQQEQCSAPAATEAALATASGRVDSSSPTAAGTGQSGGRDKKQEGATNKKQKKLVSIIVALSKLSLALARKQPIIKSCLVKEVLFKKS